MSESNNKTLQSYESNVRAYIDGTPQDVTGVIKEWLDVVVQDVSNKAHILELGSAFGRDAAYLQSLGYSVECTDATEGFIELLQQKGFSARKLNAITDRIEGSYDLVLANAVLVHFNRQETAKVLNKIFKVLSNGGKFAFTLKQGEGEDWSEEKLDAPRYFCYWTKEQIGQLLDDSGYGDIQVNTGTGARDVRWLHIIASKLARDSR